MNIVVIDGQGGGMGGALVKQLKLALPDVPVTAIGANALATAAMHRAGADACATGENAVIVNCRAADVVLGPMGIVIADSLLGEITPMMAQAVASCAARKILIPAAKCRVTVVGAQPLTLAQAVAAAVRDVMAIIQGA